MELLSPVSDFETLKAAVNSGADAVYLGGARSARKFAKPIESLPEAIAYAHIRDTRVYYAMNTIVFDREFGGFLREAQIAAEAGADALIVQDIGAAVALRQVLPDMPLHISTQAAAHNSDNVSVFEELGASRVILARELSSEQVSRIVKSTKLETEVFVHGALCYSFSGECLMSSFLGGRSANRGECAQPCRLEYKSGDNKGCLLSMKDLCLINEIDVLREAGVHCVKIEGRMKGAVYVGAVTRAYRKALDGEELTDDDFNALFSTYSRGGFTKGLFIGDKQRLYPDKPGHTGLYVGKVTACNGDYVCVRTDFEIEIGDEVTGRTHKNSCRVLSVEYNKGQAKLKLAKTPYFKTGDDVFITFSNRVVKKLGKALVKARLTPVEARAEIRVGNAAVLEMTARGKTVRVTGEEPEAAVSRALTQDDISRQLARMADTGFELIKIDVITDGLSAMSKSALNALRRNAVDQLTRVIAAVPEIRVNPLTQLSRDSGADNRRIKKLSAYARTIEQSSELLGIVDILYVPISVAEKLTGHRLPQITTQIIPAFPMITTDGDLDAFKPRFEIFPQSLVHTFIAMGGDKTAGWGFNTANSHTLAKLYGKGFSRAVISPELSAAQIGRLKVPRDMEVEVLLYGNLPLMTSCNCPINCDKTNCAVAGDAARLIDRKRMRLPLLKAGEGCRVSVYNALPIYMADRISEINADVCGLYFTVETPSVCRQIAKDYRQAIKGARLAAPTEGTFTRGRYFKKHKELTE